MTNKEELPTLYVSGDIHISNMCSAFNPHGLPINIVISGDVYIGNNEKPKAGMHCDTLNVQGNITAENFHQCK